MSYCTDCGHDIPPGSRFCPSCGADQLVTPPQAVTRPPSVLPLILGILGILFAILIPIVGLVMGILGAVLAHTDENKNGNAYTFVCIIAILVSLLIWGANIILFVSVLGL
ncbi:MAG TPA: zinc ribbon domain-containing protein [Candidatus Methanomethylophilaceae archaeon]|nr:zinc ribbon domain-containing protein [Candidatus Methanomethylophilaceae archaeon]